MQQMKERVRKSVTLTDTQRQKFEAWVRSKPTILDAAIEINVNRYTISRILFTGSTSPKTYEKIVDAIRYDVPCKN